MPTTPIIVTELKKAAQSVYRVSDSSGTRVLTYDTAIVITKDGTERYLIYDQNHNPLPISEYLSFHRPHVTPAGKKRALYGIRLLLIFCDIFRITPQEMTHSDCTRFMSFLLGESSESAVVSMRLCTERSAETVNGILSCCRKLMLYKGLLSHPLLASDGKKYIISVTAHKAQMRRPIHITPPQFCALVRAIRDSERDRLVRDTALLMVELMYLYGLRLGEVLALTAEDLSIRKVNIYDEYHDYDPMTGEIYGEEKEIGVLTLRNRVNNHDQGRGCKNLVRPVKPEDYRSKEYNEIGVGYSEVPIAIETLTALEDYIQATTLRRKHYKHYYKAMVDSIEYWQFSEEKCAMLAKSKQQTRYIFLNKNGARLCYQTWNKRLKRYFILANIPVDTGKKRDGLSHRLRHGYAMVTIARLKKAHDPAFRLKLMRAMRHRSIASIEPYFTPSQQDLVKTIDLIDRAPDPEDVVAELSAVYDSLYKKGGGQND